jgi:acetyl esterase/lipase
MPQIYMLLGQPEEPKCCCPRNPAISPLHAELHGLPPTQIHVGESEVMLNDSVDFGQKATAAGSPVTVVVWPRMWHTFTQYTEGCGGDDAEPLQEALDALQQQGKFLRGLATEHGSADTLGQSTTNEQRWGHLFAGLQG